MDAISFVMGEKTNCLRVKRLGELIHGAAIGRPVSNRCSVTAKFVLEDGSQVDFQRSVINSSADYKLNGRVITIYNLQFTNYNFDKINNQMSFRVLQALFIWKN